MEEIAEKPKAIVDAEASRKAVLAAIDGIAAALDELRTRHDQFFERESDRAQPFRGLIRRLTERQTLVDEEATGTVMAQLIQEHRNNPHDEHVYGAEREQLQHSLEGVVGRVADMLRNFEDCYAGDAPRVDRAERTANREEQQLADPALLRLRNKSLRTEDLQNVPDTVRVVEIHNCRAADWQAVGRSLAALQHVTEVRLTSCVLVAAFTEALAAKTTAFSLVFGTRPQTM